MGDVTRPAAPFLRPLGFGELFDRAITLYVRNFLPLAAIMLVILIPYAIVQYVSDNAQIDNFSEVIRILQHPGAKPHSTPFPFTNGQTAIVFGGLFLLLVALPFALNATAVAVARLYLGERIDVRDCYRAALQRFWPIVGVIFVGTAIAIGWIMGIWLVTFVLTMAGVAIYLASHVVGVVVFVIVGIVFVAMLLTIGILSVALSFAMYSVVIERKPVGSAIASGFTRVLAKQEIWRALLLTISIWALSLVVDLMLSMFVYFAVVWKQVWLMVLISTLAEAVLYSFPVVLLTAYYYDVRIRHEGFDLEAQLQSLRA